MSKPPPKSIIASEEGATDLSDERQKALIAHLSIEPVLDAMALLDFGMQELVENTILHIRDPDPAISLRGIETFRKILKDTAVNNGLIQTGTFQSQGELNGHQGTGKITAQRLVSSLDAAAPGSSKQAGANSFTPARGVVSGTESSRSGGGPPGDDTGTEDGSGDGDPAPGDTSVPTPSPEG